MPVFFDYAACFLICALILLPFVVLTIFSRKPLEKEQLIRLREMYPIRRRRVLFAPTIEELESCIEGLRRAGEETPSRDIAHLIYTELFV